MTVDISSYYLIYLLLLLLLLLFIYLFIFSFFQILDRFELAYVAGGFEGALSGGASKTCGEVARGMRRKKNTSPLPTPPLVFTTPPPLFSSSAHKTASYAG